MNTLSLPSHPLLPALNATLVGLSNNVPSTSEQEQLPQPSVAIPLSNLCQICQNQDKEDFTILNHLLTAAKSSEVLESIASPFASNHLISAQTALVGSSKNVLTLEELTAILSTIEFNEALDEIFQAKYPTLSALATKCQHLCLLQFFTEVILEAKATENGQKSEVAAESEKMEISTLVSRIKAVSTSLIRFRKEFESIIETSERKRLSRRKRSDLSITVEGRERSEKVFVDNNENALRGAANDDDLSLEDDSTQNGDGTKKNSPYNKKRFGVTKDKLPKKSISYLKTWFIENIGNPYPDSRAKDFLIKTSGLTRTQIQNWFTNARKRYLEPIKKKVVEDVPEKPAARKSNKDLPVSPKPMMSSSLEPLDFTRLANASATVNLLSNTSIKMDPIRMWSSNMMNAGQTPTGGSLPPFYQVASAGGFSPFGSLLPTTPLANTLNAMNSFPHFDVHQQQQNPFRLPSFRMTNTSTPSTPTPLNHPLFYANNNLMQKQAGFTNHQFQPQPQPNFFGNFMLNSPMHSAVTAAALSQNFQRGMLPQPIFN